MPLLTKKSLCKNLSLSLLDYLSICPWHLVLFQLYTMYFEAAENLAYPLMTFSIASSKSFSLMAFLLERIANMPASVHTDLRSAPVVDGHNLANSSNLMFFSMLMCLAWILKICVLPSRSGNPNSTFLSSLPGRSRAGSSVSGRLVAMSTLTLPLLSKPSS